MQKGFDVVNLHGTASGVIAVPYIGENGNWFIGNEDTGITAHGEKGDKGEQGPKGDKGDPGTTGPQGLPGTMNNMDILFNGNANTVKAIYDLSKPITDYNIIVVEIGDAGHVFSEWIIRPQPDVVIKKYRGIRRTTVDMAGMTAIFWHFPTTTSI